MLLKGNCLDTLKTLADNSVDSIVTDPPYELGFMGKSWDNSGIAYNADLWAECLRVLKPGGHLLAFSGSRTYHRMTVAIEDAGFEIRDQIMWLYGSGFPKSLDVSKAIDKAAGLLQHEAKAFTVAGRTDANLPNPVTNGYVPPEPQSSEAQQWQGWGTALKPAHEPIVVARKPLIGTVANNVLTYGTGALNIDGSRVGTDGGTYKASKPEGASNGIYGEGINGTVDIGELNAGRWPANVIHDGSDEVLAGFPVSKSGVAIRGKSGGNTFGGDNLKPPMDDLGYGDSGSAARFFYCAKASKSERNAGLDDFEAIQTTGGGGLTAETREDGSLETASAGGKYGSIKAKQQNFHPTVKPLALMRYLIKLVTPPNGTVLDPFLGSGSTAVAATLEGFEWIGCEMTEDYWPIIEARVAWATEQAETPEPTLFD